MGKSKERSERLPPFVPLFVETLRSPAWQVLSHGARSLYVLLKSKYIPHAHNNGRLYVSQRDAKKELGSGFEEITNWFRELQHYGFIVMIQPGCLGVMGKGLAPKWRLTEIAYMREPATRDFIGWDGTPFQRKRRASKNRIPHRKSGADRTGKPVHTSAPEIRCSSQADRTGNPVHTERRERTGNPVHNYVSHSVSADMTLPTDQRQDHKLRLSLVSDEGEAA
jgi:hypothetical protein